MGKQGPYTNLLEVANLEKGDFDHSDLSHLERKKAQILSATSRIKLANSPQQRVSTWPQPITF
jgi:hypothetical protein